MDDMEMTTSVIEHEVKLEFITDWLNALMKGQKEILEHVKKTNGCVHKHEAELSAMREWQKNNESWQVTATKDFNKIENRLWIIVLSSTLVGTVAGAIASLFAK